MENSENLVKSMITITHLVSPSQFYFRDLDDGTMEKKVDEIEQKLKAQVESRDDYYYNMHQYYVPKKDDVSLM